MWKNKFQDVLLSKEINVRQINCSLDVLIKAENSHEQFLTIKVLPCHHKGSVCKNKQTVNIMSLCGCALPFSPQQTAHADEVFSSVVSLTQTSPSQVPVVPGCLRNNPGPQGARDMHRWQTGWHLHLGRCWGQKGVTFHKKTSVPTQCWLAWARQTFTRQLCIREYIYINTHFMHHPHHPDHWYLDRGALYVSADAAKAAGDIIVAFRMEFKSKKQNNHQRRLMIFFSDIYIPLWGTCRHWHWQQYSVLVDLIILLVKAYMYN